MAIRALARRASHGKVHGLDHSEVMVRQATARNRAAVREGRVDLRLGSPANLPTLGVVVDKVLSSTTILQASVLTALGAIYGVVLPTLIGTIAFVLAGVIPYLLTPVSRLVMRVFRGRSREVIDALSDRAGPWAIALSRSLPYSVPEAIVCLAGLARMPVQTLLVSLVSGSAPAALLYAGIGAGWARDPLLALAVSYVLPILLLPGALFVVDRREPAAADPAVSAVGTRAEALPEARR